jgi:hypothetical protein
MTIEAIKQAVERFPELTAFGFGVFDEARLSPVEREISFREERQNMFTAQALVYFQKAVDWLSRQQKTKTSNQRAGTSYGIKHKMEAGDGRNYVPNGIFIAAAHACGFKVVREFPGSQGGQFELRCNSIARVLVGPDRYRRTPFDAQIII